MKRISLFLLITLILVSCSNSTFEKALFLLDSKKPAVLENILEAKQLIIQDKGLKQDQVDTLKSLFSEYLYSVMYAKITEFNQKTELAYDDPSWDSEALQDSITQAMTDLKGYGINMYYSEGNIESELMPMFFAEAFWQYLTDAEKEISRLQQKAVDSPPVQDAAILITYSDLADRLYEWDQLSRKYATDSTTLCEIENMRLIYLQLLYLGVDNSPTFDWDTKQINPEVKRVLNTYILEHPNAKSTQSIKEFIDVVKGNNRILTPEVDAFIKKELLID